MSDDEFDPGYGDASPPKKEKKKKENKRLSVERIYQKKTQLEHILLRPGMNFLSLHFGFETVFQNNNPLTIQFQTPTLDRPNL